jgi:hypothetical protein
MKPVYILSVSAAILFVIIVLLTVAVIAPSGVVSSSTAPIPEPTSTPILTPSPTPTPTSTHPRVTPRLSPTSGLIGTAVTIYASGFSPTNNTVLMNGLTGAPMKNISSPDGKTLTFTVPPSLAPNCQPDQACPEFLMLVSDNSYKISVVSNGVTQDVGTFTVTGQPTL